MNLQTLRYVLAIENEKSLRKASKLLFVSQPTLSRAIREIESQTGIVLFIRTNHGVTVTDEGKLFMQKAKKLLNEFDKLDGEYFHKTVIKDSLLIATQRCTPVVRAFAEYYKQYCGDAEYLNLALQEETTDNILKLVGSGVYDMGIIHYTSDREDEVMKSCRSQGFKCSFLDSSPICVQVRKDHPLAKHSEVTTKMLEPYPHITFADEDLTSINYCSDIASFNYETLKKRIITKERGTLRDLIAFTDGYYIGSDFSSCCLNDDESRCYIPLSDIDYTLNLVCIHNSQRNMTEAEERFYKILKKLLERNKQQTS